MIVADQLLREALGDVRGAGVVLDDQRNLLPRDGIAVLLDIKFGGGALLLAGARLLAGHRQDEADGHRCIIGESRRRDQSGANCDPRCPFSRLHRNFLPCGSVSARRPAVAYLGTVDFQNRSVALSSCASPRIQRRRPASSLRDVAKQSIFPPDGPPKKSQNWSCTNCFKNLWRERTRRGQIRESMAAEPWIASLR